MNLKEQLYIVTLANCGNVTLAAKQLGVTQPALSSYLAGVESSLGHPLFNRTGRRLVPTYLGELYLEKAHKILALGEEFQQQKDQVVSGYQGRLRVGIPIRRSPHLVPSAMKIFRGYYPNVELIFHEGNQQNMTDLLHADQLDLFLCNLAEPDQDLTYVHLCQDPVVFLIPADHPCCRYAQYRDGFSHPWIDLREFTQEVFILPHHGQSLQRYSNLILQQVGIQPQRTLLIRNIETAAQMVSQGLGVSFCLDSYFRHMSFIHPPSAFSVGDQPTVADFSAAYPKGSILPDYALQFIQLLQDMVLMESSR